MHTRNFITAAALTGAVAASFGFGGGADASAPQFASPEIGMQALDLMCAEQDGQAYPTPYTITRCQDALTRPGFEIETIVCEGLLGGTFRSAPSPSHPKRTTWTCSPGAI